MRALLAATVVCFAAPACYDQAENMGSTPYDNPTLTSAAVDAGQTDFVGTGVTMSGAGGPAYDNTLHAYGPPAPATIPGGGSTSPVVPASGAGPGAHPPADFIR